MTAIPLKPFLEQALRYQSEHPELKPDAKRSFWARLISPTNKIFQHPRKREGLVIRNSLAGAGIWRGKDHAIATVIAGGALSGLLVATQRPLDETVAFAAGCLSNLFINPDLDLREVTYTKRVFTGSLGWLLARLWYALWWPYAHLLIPRHRHPLSHWPLLGTALRLLYLGLVFGVPLYLAGWAFKMPPFPEIPPETFTLLGWWVGGLVTADTLHTLMDFRNSKSIIGRKGKKNVVR
jgi:uncharacterized metal-binding protein